MAGDLDDGTHVVFGCIEGRPELPVITAALSEIGSERRPRGRATWRSRGGATIELSGDAPPTLEEEEGELSSGRRAPMPAVAHHAPPPNLPPSTAQVVQPANETSMTDTWMRFGVPHSKGANAPATAPRPWTYLRIGEAATETPLQAGNDSFSEKDVVNDKEINLEIHRYDDQGLNLAGVFDYTDKNRTEITKGTYEQLVFGNSGEVVYGVRTRSDRTDVICKKPTFERTSAKFEGVHGVKYEHVLGSKIEGIIGSEGSVKLGYLAEFTFGMKLDVAVADTYSYGKGREFRVSKEEDVRSTEKITLAVDADCQSAKWPIRVAGAAAVIGAGAATALKLWGDDAVEDGDKEEAAMAAIAIGAPLVGIAAAKLAMKRTEMAEGNPILELAKDNKGAASLWSKPYICCIYETGINLGKSSAATLATAVGDTMTTMIHIKDGQIAIQASRGGPTITVKHAAIEIEAPDKDITIKGQNITLTAAAPGKV
jgi:hypothetical protein